MKRTIILCTLIYLLICTFSANAQWQRTGLSNDEIYCLASIGTNIFVGTSNGVFLSTNYGASWTSINNGLANSVISTFAVSGTNIFAGHDGGVFLSTDTGSNWTPVNNGLPSYNPLDFLSYNLFLAANGSNIFAVINSRIIGGHEYGSVYLTTNNGSSWTRSDSGLENTDYNVPVISAFCTNGANLFTGTNWGVYLSTNNAKSWSAVNSGLPGNADILSMAVTATKIYAESSSFNGYGLFSSVNNGSNWTPVNNNLPDSTYISEFTVSGSNIFAVNNYGIYLSSNYDSIWVPINKGLTDSLSITSFAIVERNLFAGTDLFGGNGDRVWKCSLSDILAVQNIAAINSEITIYPNPATNQLTIHSSSFHNEAVMISVMNVMGQETSPPTPLHLERGDAMIDISGLAPGMYFLQMKWESGSAVKKFVKE